MQWPNFNTRALHAYRSIASFGQRRTKTPSGSRRYENECPPIAGEGRKLGLAHLMI
jgi:hypothetical protein